MNLVVTLWILILRYNMNRYYEHCINPRDTEVFANLMWLRGVDWTPTAFYLNISRTIENETKFFCISNSIQCVNKIELVALVSFIASMTQNSFSLIFLKNNCCIVKNSFVALKNNEVFFRVSFRVWTHGLENRTFFHLSCITIAAQGGTFKQFLVKTITDFWDMRTICPKIFAKLDLIATMSQMDFHILHWKYFKHFWHFSNFVLFTQFLKVWKIGRKNTFLEWKITWQYYL